ncbi:MAG TPA: hypothetical protein VL096_07585, partial [Pirellulaceae bacterium]|nr:hypothetical protein [Pirellulaceae bacterium]
ARLAESRQTHQKVLTSRLDDACALAKQHPAAARMICTALITLYAEKPWAEESVAQAKALLQELPAEPEKQPEAKPAE